MTESPPVTLGPLTQDDSEVLFSWINDQRTVELNSTFRPVHRSGHDAWFKSVQSRQDLVIFAIREQNSGRIVGTCQLFDIHPIHRNAELQIRIGREEDRGKGYGKIALVGLTRFGFDSLNLHRIMLRVFGSNQRAIASYVRLGFLEEGRQREAAWISAQWEDVITMGLLRRDWERGA